MFSPQFPIELKKKRVADGLTQVEASRLCGIDQGFWSRIESGTSIPDPHLFRTICRVFRLSNVFLRPRTVTRSLIRQGCKLSRKQKAFIAPRDRRSHLRFRNASKVRSSLVGSLHRLLRGRPDYDVVEELCHCLCFESELEVLYVMCLLVSGAAPALFQPYLLGHLPYPVIDVRNFEEVGQRPHHCLIHGGAHYFFQVSFQTQPTVRVDVLVRRNGRWEVIEIDGPGHNPSRDTWREAALGLPTQRFKQSDLERLGWALVTERAA